MTGLAWLALAATAIATLSTLTAAIYRRDVRRLRDWLATTQDVANDERAKWQGARDMAAGLADDLAAAGLRIIELEARLADRPTPGRPPLPHRHEEQRPGDPAAPVVEQLEQLLCAPSWVPPHEQPGRNRREDGGQRS